MTSVLLQPLRSLLEGLTVVPLLLRAVVFGVMSFSAKTPLKQALISSELVLESEALQRFVAIESSLKISLLVGKSAFPGLQNQS